MKRINLKQFLLYGACILLLGCTPAPPNTATTTITSPPTETLTATPSPTGTMTATITPTPKPVYTSIVPELAMTLTPFVGDERIAQLYKQPLCAFPCWWNITPGRTTWEDVKDFFSFLGLESRDDEPKEYTKHDIRILTSESIYFVNMRVFEKDGAVQYIILQGYLENSNFRKLYAAYEPKKILQTYGAPSRVKVFASLLDRSYTLDLFYDEQGFWLIYSGRLSGRTPKGGAYVCPDFLKGHIGGMGIHLQAPNIKSSIEHFPDEDLKTGLRIIGPYWDDLENATGLTIDQFRDLFVGEKSTSCFTVLKPG